MLDHITDAWHETRFGAISVKNRSKQDMYMLRRCLRKRQLQHTQARAAKLLRVIVATYLEIRSRTRMAFRTPLMSQEFLKA